MPTLTVNNSIDYDMTVKENVSFAVSTAANRIKMSLNNATKQMGEDIKQGVIEEFDRRRKSYHEAPITVMSKGRSNPLVHTGRLKYSLDRAKVKVNQTENSSSVTISWNFPQSGGSPMFPELRKKSNHTYIWSHEFGTDAIPQYLGLSSGYREGMMGRRGGGLKLKAGFWNLEPRPFFFDGLDRGKEKAVRDAVSEIAPAVDLETLSATSTPRVYTITTKNARVARGINVTTGEPFSIFPNIIPTTLKGLMFWFVPPSKYYMYLGAASDLQGLLSGSLLQPGTAANYLRQMGWAKTGFTKKIIRRKFRGRLWGRT